MAKLHCESIDRLFRAILSLESSDDCYRFFEDICTVRELQDMAQRLETAIMLDEGVGYQEIAKKIGISTATISRVSRCLNYGEGGYRAAIDRLNASEGAR